MNFRKLISSALLFSLITVVVPTPLDSKANAMLNLNVVGPFCALLAIISLGVTAYGAPNLKKCFNAINSPNSCVNHSTNPPCQNAPCIQDTAAYNSHLWATFYSIITAAGVLGTIGGFYGVSKNP